jgi:hypothetical protein
LFLTLTDTYYFKKIITSRSGQKVKYGEKL